MSFISTVQAQVTKVTIPVEKQVGIITDNLPLFGGFIGVLLAVIAITIFYMRWEHRKDIYEIRAAAAEEIKRVHDKSEAEIERFRALMEKQLEQANATLESERKAAQDQMQLLQDQLQRKILEAERLERDLKATRRNITELIKRINPKGDFGEVGDEPWH